MVTVTAFNAELVQSRRDLAPAGIVAQHGLLRTASPGSSVDSRWLIEGVNFVPTLCTALHNQPLPNWCTDFDPPHAAGGGTRQVDDGPVYQTCPGVMSFKPFIVEIATDVRFLPTVPSRNQSVVGGLLQEHDWISDRLAIGLSQAIEEIIWPAVNPGTPWLGDGVGIIAPADGGALGAVGQVEAAILSAKAGAGVIHMGPTVAAQVTEYLVEDGSGILRTRGTGSKVVVGNYPTSKIAGHVGDIDLYLGPNIYSDEAFDHRTNHVYQHAWIEAAVAWHTCATWLVDISGVG